VENFRLALFCPAPANGQSDMSGNATKRELAASPSLAEVEHSLLNESMNATVRG
jgi:hypothetical protein